jgi:hypothetical protein
MRDSFPALILLNGVAGPAHDNSSFPWLSITFYR